MDFLKEMLKRLVGHTEESLTRAVMNERTKEWVNALPTDRMDAFEISGLIWKKRVTKPWKSFTEGWYPEFDICTPLVETARQRYDIVFAEQVFEHLAYPYRAVKNVYEMLRPGGYCLLTVPFLFKIHASPTDCTRWTPQGLAYLLEEGGFAPTAIRTDAWGNRQAVRLQLRPRNYCTRLHSLKNEPEYPVAVWALARK
ncbi:MAG: methyltransferase domain-containing protein [Kiritimatiellae bacterium]|nr:methyltransferase domain-containing protein [Kiritimatiellia bacterium]